MSHNINKCSTSSTNILQRVCMHIMGTSCVCMLTYMWVRMHVCACACKGLKLTHCIFSNQSFLYYQCRGSCLIWISWMLASLVRLQGMLLSPPKCWDGRQLPYLPGFLCGFSGTKLWPTCLQGKGFTY